MCTGLGDLILKRCEFCLNPELTNDLLTWLHMNHDFISTPDGFNFWFDIYNILCEMENGEGIDAKIIKDDNFEISSKIVGYGTALVIHFDCDVKGKFRNKLKSLASYFCLDIIAIIGNTVVVMSENGADTDLNEFKECMNLVE
jgi:hypothetical protein